MRSSRPALVVSCAVVLFWSSLAPPPAAAEKRSMRHFPVPKWCSIVSGHTSPFDLTGPYLFTTPVGQSKVTVIFKADNRNVAIDDWNNQRLDNVVVVRADTLPSGTQAVCFTQPLSGPCETTDPPSCDAVDPPASPSATGAVFSDNFRTGAKAEWGAVPAGTLEGAAPAPVFWQPFTSTTVDTAQLLFEDFSDAPAHGWSSVSIPGATNLWRPGATDCPLGSVHLAFSRPDPDCNYDVAGQGRVGGIYLSPIIDLTDAAQTAVSFEHSWGSAAQPMEWSVEASEDGGTTWPIVLLQAADRDATSLGLFVAETLNTASRSAQFRLRFRFDTGAAASETGAGWYIANVNVTASYGGSLALGRSTRQAGQLIDAGEVIARLNLSNLTGDTDYAVTAQWNSEYGAQNIPPPPNVTTYLTIDHVFDSTAPSNPTLTSSTHIPNVWSQTGQVSVQWSGATDPAVGTGVAGYSSTFDAAAATVPDATLEVPHAADPHSFTTGALTDGGGYYFHLRTCDFALNCSPAAHLGPFRIDRVAPSPVTALASSSHTIGVSSADRTIDVGWTSATDATSGVDGYAFTFDNNSTWVCDQTKDTEEGATGTTSATLAAGSWYFHVCTRDNAGLWSGVANLGPFPITVDTTAPTNPTLSSPTHTVNVWSNANVVTVNWSGSTDAGSGMAGYSVAFDAAAATIPNTSVDVVHTTDPHSFGSGALADGGSYYFHLRACDVAANCSTAVHLGPFRIDQTAPGTVSGLTSPSHGVGVSSADPTIDVTWSAASDASSGVDGYSVFFDSASTAVCEQTKDVEETATTATSSSLGSGTWYVHICTRDNAGNWSAVANAGPYVVGTGGPTPARLRTLTPCRLVDTRGATGELGGPALAAGQERPFTADLGCDIPPTARALSVNVTVVSPTAPGNLRLYSPGSGVPLSSVINYTPGQTRANNGIVPLNPARQFAVRCDQASGTVHLLVDVNGYFE